MAKPKLTGGEVVKQFTSPIAPVQMVGGLFGMGPYKDEPENTMVEFTPTQQQAARAPVVSGENLSDEEMAQLEMYAAMNGMSLDDYIVMLQDQEHLQAPDIQHRAQVANSPEARQKRELEAAGAEAEAANESITARDRQDANDFWNNNVTTALDAQRTAAARQIAGNAQSEQELETGRNTLRSELAGTQARRQAGITGANAAATSATNTLNSQLGGYNQRQDAANDYFQSQLQQSNQAANQNRDQLTGDLMWQTMQGNENTAVHGNALDALNLEDQRSLANYMQTTNPFLAEQVARGSDSRYVQQQQDVHDRWKALSNPEITAQERFVAEQLRRKFENDDRGSREAAMADMRARGLNSGGQQIASQLASRQATAGDRVLAELGLSASAQGRAMGALQNQGDIAGQLRNADDAMRNFQDQYAQNDWTRRANLANQQQGLNQANTAQRGARQNDIYDAQRANLNDATNRSGMTFDAGRNTINDNSNRDAQGYDATTNTINNNSGRDISAFNATTGTINDNFGRDQYGWNSADTNANTNWGATTTVANARTTNRANEAGTASNVAGTNLSGAGTRATIQGGISQAERDDAAAREARRIRNAVGVMAPDDEDEN